MARYILVETIVSMVVNALFSAAFTFLVFAGRTEIGLWGPGGLALDFLPQTFMIAMMSVLVPTALTRRRIRAGTLQPGNGPATGLPRQLFGRALLVALFATFALGGAAIALLTAVWSGPVAFASVLPLKVIYGAGVALLVTPLAVRAALSDGGWQSMR